MTFVLTSRDVTEGGMLGDAQVLSEDFGFGCRGRNLSPELSWSGAPDSTRSYALTCYDPDAPTGSGFWHWFVVNIPGNVMNLPAGAGSLPNGSLPGNALQIRTDFGRPGYGGPCPPPGGKPHRYIFTVHALEVEELQLPAECTAALAGFFVHQSTVAKATLTALFKR